MCPNPEATPDSLRGCNDTQPPQDPKNIIANFCSVYIAFVTIQENVAFKEENHRALPLYYSGIVHRSWLLALRCFTT